MYQCKYEKLKNWFEKYYKQFDEEKDIDVKNNLKLKYVHMHNVVKVMEYIINDMNFSEKEKDMLKIIALFHDIGRFNQVSKYKTYDDKKSEDHGDTGVIIVKEEKLLEDFDDDDKQIIYNAIKYHNKKQVPYNELSSEEIKYIDLIRDADKSDIYRVLLDIYENNGINIIENDGVNNKLEITDIVYKHAIHERSLDYSELETINDRKILQFIWIYDITYNKTIEYILENKFLERIYNTVQTEDEITEKRINNIYMDVNKYIKDKIGRK